MPDLGQLHDGFFKSIFAHIDVAADFLRHYLPAPVVAVLDMDTLTLEPGSWVDPKLRQYYSDLLYRVRTRDGPPVLVYVLVEHKSRPDRLVAFQLLRYLVRMWEESIQSGEGLVPVIPVVVYHGRARWRVGRDFQDLYDGPAELRHYFPAFRYHLSDISTTGGTELVGELWLRAVLAVLRHIFSSDLAERLPVVMSWLNSVEGEPGLADLWRVVVEYVLQASRAGVTEAEVRAALDVGFAGRGEAMMATVVDTWIEQGVQEGERRGLLAGIEVALDLRFGADGLALMPQIVAIGDVMRLQSIQSALRTAASIDEVRRLIA